MTNYPNTPQHPQQPPNIYVQAPVQKTNGMGVAGFIIALLALFLGWVPFIGWLLWLLGLIFSFIGVFKPPRGLAIAGLCISLIGVIILIIVSFALAGAASYSGSSNYYF